MEPERLIDAVSAGLILNIHPKTVKRLSREGVIPGMRIGKLWRYRESSLDEWARTQIDSNRHPFPGGENR